MKNTEAKIINKRLHGWLDDDANHVPLPPLSEEVLAKAVFQVPDSWVPVYAVSFACDKGEEPAPDAWLKPDGDLVRNQPLLNEHAKQFGMPESFIPLYFGDAEQDSLAAQCQCVACRLNRYLDQVREVAASEPEQDDEDLEALLEAVSAFEAVIAPAMAREKAAIAEQEATERAIFDDANPFEYAEIERLSGELNDTRHDLFALIDAANDTINAVGAHYQQLGIPVSEDIQAPLAALANTILVVETIYCASDAEPEEVPDTIAGILARVAEGSMTPDEAEHAICGMVAEGEGRHER